MKKIILALIVVGGLVGIPAAAFAAAPVAPTATTGPVTTTSPTTATVTGTVNPQGSATHYYFEYGVASSSGFTAQTPTHSAGGGAAGVSVSATLSGLSAGTSFRYALVAVNAAGTTTGSPAIVNTSAPPTVVTGIASSVTSTSAILNGVINPQDLATKWFFEYGTTTAYGTDTVPQTLPASSGNVNVKIAVTPLTPKQTYHFRLVAKSAAGTVFGTDFHLSTDEALTLTENTSAVNYGGSVVLGGVVTSGQAGVAVAILAQPFSAPAFSTIASVTTTAGGAFTYTALPSARTTYEATATGGTSSPAIVGVRPVVTLSVAANHLLTTKVSGGISFGGHILQLQRLVGAQWVTWKHVALNARGKSTFATALPAGKTMVRMAIGPFQPGIDQAAPGYLAGFSSEAIYRTN